MAKRYSNRALRAAAVAAGSALYASSASGFVTDPDGPVIRMGMDEYEEVYGSTIDELAFAFHPGLGVAVESAEMPLLDFVVEGAVYVHGMEGEILVVAVPGVPTSPVWG